MHGSRISALTLFTTIAPEKRFTTGGRPHLSTPYEETLAVVRKMLEFEQLKGYHRAFIDSIRMYYETMGEPVLHHKDDLEQQGLKVVILEARTHDIPWNEHVATVR